MKYVKNKTLKHINTDMNKIVKPFLHLCLASQPGEKCMVTFGAVAGQYVVYAEVGMVDGACCTTAAAEADSNCPQYCR